MSHIWNKMQDCADVMRDKMLRMGEIDQDPILEKYNWENHVYRSSYFRRGHVEVVDQRENYGLFILHATVFPRVDSDAPIWGFDAVCGKNKITGAFHDFSLVDTEDNFMYQWFKDTTKDITWKKERELPDWAKAIFSPSMVAVGNVQDELEVDQFIKLGLDTLDYYISNANLCKIVGKDYTEQQNRYCYYQKQNPHVVRSMVAMGYEQHIIENFVEEVLFPEIK